MKPDRPSALRYQTLLRLLRTADSIWNASHAFFARWDLSPSQFNVLNLLHGLPFGLSQSEVGRELIMHRSNITGLVDRLERRGLVARMEVPGDRRVYRVVLTSEGTRIMDEVLPLYYQKAEELWGNCPPKVLAEISTQLVRAAENATRIAREGGKEERSRDEPPRHR
jgi:DNA-binding MarR family transcriptional regulator